VTFEFALVVDPSAARDLKKLRQVHHPMLPRIKHAIDSLGREPWRGKPLKGSKAGCYSDRVGDFRIVYEVYQELRTIHIIQVGDRKEVYR